MTMRRPSRFTLVEPLVTIAVVAMPPALRTAPVKLK